LTQLTDNEYWNVYPIWPPDGSEVLFLTLRESLDIYVMNTDGGDQRLFYDSGGHDGDIDWVDDHIVFTRNSQIWVMNSDGSDPHQLTDPPRAGEWGNAVLPFGDYDPRISPDGSLVVFERMVDDSSPHGNYDLFIIGIDGTDDHAVTDLDWTLGIARWSSDGEELIFQVSAVGEAGKYDVYSINADGSGLIDLTGDLYPAGFLVHNPVYSGDDSSIYFMGQWWDWKVLGSTLSCSVSKSTISVGDSVSVSGSVQPQVQDIDISLTLTGPDGSETTSVVSSDDGSYVYSFTPDALGSWSAKVSWGGDLGHSESESDAISFSVEEAETGGGGVPGFSFLAVSLGVSLLLLVRRRSPTSFNHR
jgi:Tol biopolymer transport system component